MEHVWQKIEELRAEYEILRVERTPIDVFTFFEVDLRLDPIPFPRLTLKYRVEAAITADFTAFASRKIDRLVGFINRQPGATHE